MEAGGSGRNNIDLQQVRHGRTNQRHRVNVSGIKICSCCDGLLGQEARQICKRGMLHKGCSRTSYNGCSVAQGCNRSSCNRCPVAHPALGHCCRRRGSILSQDPTMPHCFSKSWQRTPASEARPIPVEHLALHSIWPPLLQITLPSPQIRSVAILACSKVSDMDSHGQCACATHKSICCLSISLLLVWLDCRCKLIQ